MQPIVIIGAARSGTNMLRDVLAQARNTTTWPCDEINYVWRHGNAAYPSDELPSTLASPRVTAFIRRAFEKRARSNSATRIVEKTCANSLRVPFVHAVLPDAKFVFIVRDGRDVVASAMRRWQAPLDLIYTLRKARFVPLGDAPLYAAGFLLNRFHKMRSAEQRLGTWGPRFDGIDEVLVERSLAEVCALQWRRSVELAEMGLAAIPPASVHCLRYEDFVRVPRDELERLREFLTLDFDEGAIDDVLSNIQADSIGKWKKSLDRATLESLESILGPPLRQFGYA
jgi:hypothetical protein